MQPLKVDTRRRLFTQRSRKHVQDQAGHFESRLAQADVGHVGSGLFGGHRVRGSRCQVAGEALRTVLRFVHDSYKGRGLKVELHPDVGGRGTVMSRLCQTTALHWLSIHPLFAGDASGDCGARAANGRPWNGSGGSLRDIC